MNELINIFKTYPQEEQQRILNKYSDAISTLYKKINDDELFLILYCLEYTFKILNEKYNNESKEVKTWCIVILMRHLKNNSINSIENINNIINNTIDFFKSDEYNDYLSDIILYTSEYSRDVEYLNKLYNQEYY